MKEPHNAATTFMAGFIGGFFVGIGTVLFVFL